MKSARSVGKYSVYFFAALSIAATQAACDSGRRDIIERLKPGPMIRYEYAGEWEGERSGEGRFESFVDIAVAPNGNVYVTVSGNGRVQCFTGEGNYLGHRDAASIRKKWRRFQNPGPIAIGPDGTVYVIAASDFKVDCFTLTGSFIRGWEHLRDRRREWWDLAVAGNGDVYVNEIAAETDALLRFTAEGVLIGKREISYSRTGPRYTGKVAAAPNGNVFVTDLNNDRVYRFSKDLRLIAVWGSAGESSVQFNMPQAITVGPDNIVFVEDVWGPYDSSRLRAFSINGELLGQVPIDNYQNRKRPVRITNLAVGPDGTLYAVDPPNHKVFYFRPVSK